MKLKVHYGEGIQVAEIPDSCDVEVLEGKEGPGTDEDMIMHEAIEHPLGSPSLEKFLEGGNALIVVNDGDRPTPTPKFLKSMIGLIEDRPDTRILIACGTHRKPTDEDLRFIFGEYLDRLKGKIFHHDSKNPQGLVKVGTTSYGNDILMNIHVAWADKIVVTGSVEPHYFAGYTGGRKWVIGVGAFESIERNHKHALSDASAAMALTGNPVHDELVEWDALVDKPKFCINVVQDRNMRIAAAFAGDMDRVFEKCVKVGEDLYSAPTKGEADIVLTVARPPMDNELYQALKAQEHGKLAMKDGAILILVARCRHGLGPSHFKDMLTGLDIEILKKSIEKDFHLPAHKMAKLLNTFKKGQVWVVTDIPAEELTPANMERFATVQDALDKAVRKMGRHARVVFLPDGSMTVPLLKKSKLVSKRKSLRGKVKRNISKTRSKVKVGVKKTKRKVREFVKHKGRRPNI